MIDIGDGIDALIHLHLVKVVLVFKSGQVAALVVAQHGRFVLAKATLWVAVGLVMPFALDLGARSRPGASLSEHILADVPQCVLVFVRNI